MTQPDSVKYSPSFDNIDDELGFDPFEETNKALAEDIIIEKKERELQQQRQQSFHQSHEVMRPKSFLSNNSASSLNSRLPPPGFNGVSLPSNFGNALHARQDKMLPSFLANLNGALQQSQPLNGLNRLNNIPPPGLSLIGSNMQQGHLSAALSGGLNASTLGAMDVNVSNTLLSGLDSATLVQQQTGPPPPGLSAHPKADPFSMKDMDNGLRNLLSSPMTAINSLGNSASSGNAMGSFNTINGLTMNPLASLAANLNTNNTNLGNFALGNQQQQQQQMSALNSLGNFGGLGSISQQQTQQNVANSGMNALSSIFTMAAQEQQQQQQQQQHQQLPLQQQLPQNLLQQITLNSIHNQSQKSKFLMNFISALMLACDKAFECDK